MAAFLVATVINRLAFPSRAIVVHLTCPFRVIVIRLAFPYPFQVITDCLAFPCPFLVIVSVIVSLASPSLANVLAHLDFPCQVAAGPCLAITSPFLADLLDPCPMVDLLNLLAINLNQLSFLVSFYLGQFTSIRDPME